MKILALFILFVTPLWAFKGEEYWNGFETAYTQGKVRNLYHYLEKLSDLEAEVIPEEMRTVEGIDYRLNSINYFTITGGKYGFRSTPATPQEWEQHKKALVFSGVISGLRETCPFDIFDTEELQDTLDNNKMKYYLSECEKIVYASRSLSINYNAGFSSSFLPDYLVDERRQKVLFDYFSISDDYYKKFNHLFYPAYELQNSTPKLVLRQGNFPISNQDIKDLKDFLKEAGSVFTPILKGQTISALYHLNNYLNAPPYELIILRDFAYVRSPLKEDIIQSHIRDFNLADLFGELVGIPNFSKQLKPLRPMLVTLQTGATAQRKENGGVRLTGPINIGNMNIGHGSVFDAGISLNFGTVKLGGDQTEEEFLEALQKLAPIKAVRYL